MRVNEEEETNASKHPGSHVLFEPCADMLKSLGLHAYESLLTVQENGNVLVPVQNVGGGSAIRLEKGMKIGSLSSITENIEDVHFCKDYPEEVEDEKESKNDGEKPEELLKNEQCQSSQMKESSCGCEIHTL